MLRIAFLVGILLLCVQAQAQEMLGMNTGSFSGIHGVTLNPASMINARQYIDIQVLGVASFVDNNYLYVPKEDYSLHTIMTQQGQLYTEEHPSPDKYTIYDYYTKQDKKVYSSLHVMSPGLMLSAENHAFAFQTQYRNLLSLRDIPFHVAKFALEGLSYEPQQNLQYQAKDFQISELNWAEMDFSYAYRIYHKNSDAWSIGITAKRLAGIAGFNMLVRDAEYMAPSHDTLYVYNLDADIGISVPIDSKSNDPTLNQRIFRGNGWGWDFGIYYQHSLVREPRSRRMSPSLCGQPFRDYRFKIGLSLLDFGKIHFKQDANLLKFNNVDVFWPAIDTTKYDNIDQAIDDLSTRFYGDSTAARVANDFYMPLPTMLCLQYDQNIGKGFYVNTVLMYGLRLSPETPWRPSQLAVVPRFESRNFSASMPISLYDLNRLRVGACFRIFFLTVGTDMLRPFIGGSDFTGIDVYGSLKISLNKGYCKKKGKIRHCGNAEYLNFLRLRR